MFLSMTGFGKGEVLTQSGKFTVEIQSINRKYFELNINLPKNFLSLESKIRKQVSLALSRGRVTVQVYYDGMGQSQGEVVVNRPLARRYYETYKKIQKELHLVGDIPLNLIVQAQDVIRYQPTFLDADKAWPHVAKGLQLALNRLLQMRLVEGKALEKEIADRLKKIRRSAKHVEKIVPKTVKQYELRLLQKIRETDKEAKKEEELIMKEIALFADRIDVTEELTRLESHLDQFEGLMKKKEPVGRALDFILQEMHREVNTVGSKSANSSISQEVIHLKSEIEKVREQVQNVE